MPTSEVYTIYQKGLIKALNVLGKEIVSIWQRQAPVKTGKLKSSISYKVKMIQGEPALTFNFLYYGKYTNLGTLKHADKSSYGLSPFKMPPYNSRPGHVVGGIKPTYWTSVSGQSEDLIKRFEILIAKVTGESLETLNKDNKMSKI